MSTKNGGPRVASKNNDYALTEYIDDLDASDFFKSDEPDDDGLDLLVRSVHLSGGAASARRAYLDEYSPGWRDAR